MASRHLYSWLALIAASLTLATSFVHGLMEHTPSDALDVPAFSAAAAAGHGGAHGSAFCGACLAASQARGALSTPTRLATAPRQEAHLLAPTRVATFAARFSVAPASPRAPPRALFI